MSSAEKFLSDLERWKAEAHADSEERQRRVREAYVEVKTVEIIVGAATELIEGLLKPVVDAWAENLKAASAPEKHSSHPQ
jgi:hypothetical protein